MNVVPAAVLGVSGAIAGVPVAAVAFGVAATGPIQLPRRWWTGAPARPAAVAATCAVAGTTAAIPGAVLPINPALAAFWTFAVIGVGLAIVDVRRRRLPHLLTDSMLISALLCFTATAILENAAATFLRAVGAGVATAGLLFAVALALPGQLGLGDITFAGAVTFTLGWLSWPAAAFGLVLGIGLQAAVVLARRRRHPNSKYPLGPALLAGWIVSVALVGPGL